MTPDTSLHLAQATFTLLFTSVSEPPSAANILPRYLITFIVCIGQSPNFMFSSLCGVGIYSVLVLLMRSPCLSNWSLHLSNSCSTFSLDVSQSTRSSANSIDSGGLLPSSLAKTSMIIMKRRGLSAEPWWRPRSILKLRRYITRIKRCFWFT